MKTLPHDDPQDIQEETGTPSENGSDSYLTVPEEERLFRVARDREAAYRNGFRQRAVVELALYTGAKVSELMRLNCGDLALTPGVASLRIASESHPRVLPLSPRMAEYFAHYLRQKQAAGEKTGRTDALVCSQLGSRLTLRGWQAAWALAQRHAGLEDGTGKALYNLEVARRTCGRRLYAASGNPHHVQAWLGLDLTSNADRYRPEALEITVETLRQLVEKIALPLDQRVLPNSSLDLAMGFYNGTAGMMNRDLAKRLILDASPDDPRREMWVARGLSRGRCLFPENHRMGTDKAARVVDQVRAMAEAGDPLAVFLYASANDEGLAIPQDLEASAHWYQKAVDLGVETAYTNLGLKYYFGSGVARDEARAFRLFSEGAALHEGSCMFNLASLYHEGVGTHRDLAAAIRWYTKAALIGEVRSMNNLSVFYYDGIEVPRDERVAERWFCLAGELTHAYDGAVSGRPPIEMIRLVG